MPTNEEIKAHIERLFFKTPIGCDKLFDLNEDGTVDVSDLEILSAHWNDESFCDGIMREYNNCKRPSDITTILIIVVIGIVVYMLWGK